MNLQNLALPFEEDEIEWRIAQCGVKGNGQIWATCLAYVSARAIMNRLDEVCGPENWKVGYRFEGGGVIAQLGIKICRNKKDETGTPHSDYTSWVFKEDGADNTEIEPFKGGLSSALKRAGSVWGIGRYLYGLETGFCQITEDKRGAKFGKTKEGKAFYWLPPALPQWALPKGKKASGPPSIAPDQPKSYDGKQEDSDSFENFK